MYFSRQPCQESLFPGLNELDGVENCTRGISGKSPILLCLFRFFKNTQIHVQIHIKIQIHKYKYKYKYTYTNTQIQMYLQEQSIDRVSSYKRQPQSFQLQGAAASTCSKIGSKYDDDPHEDDDEDYDS